VRFQRLLGLLSVMVACIIMSCAHPKKNEPVFSSATDVKRYAYLGLAKIRASDYPAARKYFALGLRENPRNCTLNFFNGLSYQLEGQDGSEKLLELARVGYRNAIRNCPDDPWPYFYSGVLAVGRGDYFYAEKMFANANQVTGNRVTLFLNDYLYSAYRIGDIRAIKVVLARLQQIDPSNPLTNKLNAAFQNIPVPKSNPFVKKQLSQKTTVKNNAKQVLIDGVLILSRETATNNRGVNLLKGLTMQYGNGTTPGLLYSNASTGTQGLRGQVNSANGATTTLPTLPYASQLTSIISVPVVTYDMNIFNDADEKSEIVARPSITVENDHQATYFSGTQLILGIEGTQTGTIEKLPLGVTMKLTPHFQPNGTIDLDIDMGREFLVQKAGTAFNSFTQVAQTLKENTNTTVNLTYGQTVVLSTLYDTRVEKTENRTPFLSDLPIISTFFKNTTKSVVQTNLITLLTPVKSVSFPTQTVMPSQEELTDYYQTVLALRSRVPAVLDTLKEIEIYRIRPSITPSLSYGNILGKAEKLEFRSMYGYSNLPDHSSKLPLPR